MKQTRIFLIALLALVSIVFPHVLWGQSVNPAVEVSLRQVSFRALQERLFGLGGLLSQNQPFDLKVEGLFLTPQQVHDFFSAAVTVTNPLSQAPMDFATLAQRVQQLAGSEVKIEGFLEVPGAADIMKRVPFEAKIEAGDVKIEGLSLTPARLTTLFNRLQSIDGIREVKIEALVNGRLVEAKFENGGGRIRTRLDSREAMVGRGEEGSEPRGRGLRGTSASINNERARDRGQDLDHSIRGRDRAQLEQEKMERPERAERLEQPERVEKVGQPERLERMERPERVERVERAERAEKIERPERLGRIERPERAEKIERPARIERVELPIRVERSERRGR